MPREAARQRLLRSPVFRQVSPDSHDFPHIGPPEERVTTHTRGVLMRPSALLRTLQGVERHLLFTCPDECGISLRAATRTSTRRVRIF